MKESPAGAGLFGVGSRQSMPIIFGTISVSQGQ